MCLVRSCFQTHPSMELLQSKWSQTSSGLRCKIISAGKGGGGPASTLAGSAAAWRSPCPVPSRRVRRRDLEGVCSALPIVFVRNVLLGRLFPSSLFSFNIFDKYKKNTTGWVFLRSERPSEGLCSQQRRPTHGPSSPRLPASLSSHRARRSDPCTEAKPQPPPSCCQRLREQGRSSRPPRWLRSTSETFLLILSVASLL